jgi:hypothetical protein
MPTLIKAQLRLPVKNYVAGVGLRSRRFVAYMTDGATRRVYEFTEKEWNDLKDLTTHKNVPAFERVDLAPPEVYESLPPDQTDEQEESAEEVKDA